MRLAPEIAIADGAASPAKSWSRATAALAVAAVFIFMLLVWVGASGVRGSDQYWYIADVESLVDGRGVQTNEIYPVSIRSEIAPLPRPFVHNILNIYVVALPALIFGAYGGWIAVNLFSSLLTAFVIFCTVVRLADSHGAALTGALIYLLLPVTVWQTTQPLAEASIAPLVAVSAYLYVTAAASYWRWILLMVVAALLVYCRESFAPLLLLVPVAYVIHTRPPRFGRFVAAAGLATLGAVLWVLGKHLFEPYMSASYMSVLASAGPNASNMNTFFDLSGEPPTISAIIAKVLHGLAIQFVKINAGYFLFYLPFNMMALVPLVLLLKYRRAGIARVATAGLLAVTLQMLTAIVVQNQFRYLLIATPPLLVAVGVGLGRAEWFRTSRAPVIAMIVAVLIAVAPGAVLAWRSHGGGVQDRQVRENLAAAFGEKLHTGDTVMVALDLTEGFDAQVLGYVLRPRRVLYVSDRYNADDYAALIRNANAKWLLSRRDAPVLDRLTPLVPRDPWALPAPFADWSVFSIESAGGAP